MKKRFPSAVDQICAIWVDRQIKGTGFLVGPDLVLTCHHVIKDIIEKTNAYDQNGDPCLACLFDYLAASKPHSLKDVPNSVTIALPARETDRWLVAKSPTHPDDGKIINHASPDPSSYLDFALIRLETSVGLSGTMDGGGPLRGWIDLPKKEPDLQQGRRVFVVQHPAQLQLQYDLGEYYTQIGAHTRILYGTNATHGSSGAPCFDGDFNAVGVHSGAANVPNEPVLKLNHGIRLDHIALNTEVAASLPAVGAEWNNANSAAPLWSVSADRLAPRPVLGRQHCLDRINTLLAPASEKRVLVVAEPDTLRGAGGHGKSFTIHILQAMLRNTGHMVVAFAAAPERQELAGAERDPNPPVPKEELPSDPAKLLRTIGRRLGWLGSDFDDMPERPRELRQSARWISTSLPAWFAQKLEDKARAADLVEKSAGGQDTLARLTWIVLDDVHRSTKSLEDIDDLLAGLVGAGTAESDMPAGLRSLRFVIIGHFPDALRDASERIETEEIAATALTVEHLLTCMRAAFLARSALSRFDPATHEIYTSSILELGKDKKDAKDYLRFVGRFMAVAVTNALKVKGP